MRNAANTIDRRFLLRTITLSRWLNFREILPSISAERKHQSFITNMSAFLVATINISGLADEHLIIRSSGADWQAKLSQLGLVYRAWLTVHVL